jgi:general secretion pathway protein N
VRHSRPRATFILILSLSALVFSSTARTEEQGRAAAPLANPVAAQPLEQLPAIVDRSLFSPSRRPPAAPPPPVVQAPAAAAPPSAPPNVVLLGVVMDGQNARAVLQVGADKRLLRAQMGDEIDGWKVAQIDGRKVVLASQDGRFATYRLFSDERGGADANGGAAPGRPNNSQLQQAPSPAGGLELVQQTRPR